MALAPRRALVGGAVQLDHASCRWPPGPARSCRSGPRRSRCSRSSRRSPRPCPGSGSCRRPAARRPHRCRWKRRRDGGAAHGAVLQVDLHLHGGVAAAVQDLAAQDVNDFDHLLHGNHFFLLWAYALSAGTGAMRSAGPSPSVDDQGLPVHLLGLFQAHQVQHGGGDVGQAAVPQLTLAPTI